MDESKKGFLSTEPEIFVVEKSIPTYTNYCFNTKTVDYKCCLIGILPFFYVKDCIKCGFCQFF